MKSGIHRTTLFLVLILLFGCKPSNYCSELKRSLSDDELILDAIRGESYRINFEDSDNSAEAYLAKHPNCCKVYRKEGLSVQMYYKTNKSYQENANGRDGYYEQNVEMNACGKVLEHYGMGVKESEVACWAREEKVSRLSDPELTSVALVHASKHMRLETEVDSISKFIEMHPSCCTVKRKVQDPFYKNSINAAQIDIFYEPQAASSDKGINHILVALNACAEFAHMYGPAKVEKGIDLIESHNTPLGK
jgi:hypothetical protein